MSINGTPYIGFNGQAAEALDFYRDVFGGELRTIPWHTGQGIMHGHLTTAAGWNLMAADNSEATGEASKEQRVTICVWGDDEAAMTEQFNKLAADGTVGMPLQQQEWGDTFGGVKDRYGVDWGFNIESGQTQV